MIVLDVEIKKAIPPRKGEPPLPEGIEACGGWRDFANMGVACVCTYDITTHLSRVFLEEDMQELARYLLGKPTAGFNTVNFDNRLLAEHGIRIDADQHYDMLREIWIALGVDPDKFYYKTHGGWSLDAVCRATLGIAKTGHGALAPVWWQQGRRGKVIDYCLNDVWMEGSLLLYIINGGLVTNGKETIRVAPPKRQDPEVLAEVRRMASAGDPWINVDYGGIPQRDVRGVVNSELNRVPTDAEKEVERNISPGGLGIIR